MQCPVLESMPSATSGQCPEASGTEEAAAAGDTGKGGSEDVAVDAGEAARRARVGPQLSAAHGKRDPRGRLCIDLNGFGRCSWG